MAGEALIKEANSGKNNWKPGLGSNVIEKGENGERRNHSQESTQILNSNTSAFLCELLHADLSYVPSLIGSKKEIHTLVVKFQKLWWQLPVSEDRWYIFLQDLEQLIYNSSFTVYNLFTKSLTLMLTACKAGYVKNIHNPQGEDRRTGRSVITIYMCNSFI